MKDKKINLSVRIIYSAIILSLLLLMVYLFTPKKEQIRAHDTREKHSEIYKSADVVFSYYTINRRLPENLEEIIKNDSSSRTALRDPWNKEEYLEYKYEDKTTFTLISCGPDKKRNIGAPDFYDDITIRTNYFSTGTTIPCDITLTFSIKSENVVDDKAISPSPQHK